MPTPWGRGNDGGFAARLQGTSFCPTRQVSVLVKPSCMVSLRPQQRTDNASITQPWAVPSATLAPNRRSPARPPSPCRAARSCPRPSRSRPSRPRCSEAAAGRDLPVVDRLAGRGSSPAHRAAPDRTGWRRASSAPLARRARRADPRCPRIRRRPPMARAARGGARRPLFRPSSCLSCLPCLPWGARQHWSWEAPCRRRRTQPQPLPRINWPGPISRAGRPSSAWPRPRPDRRGRPRRERPTRRMLPL